MLGHLTSDIADPGLADEGARRIEWSARAMPVLAQLRERFARTRPFAGIRVGACLHVTAETAVLVRALVAGGAEVALCASNPLSTRDDVAAALVRDAGVEVFARQGASVADYTRALSGVLDRRPQLILDDGCDLVGLLHSGRRDALPDVLAGCEDTTTGVLQLRQLARDGALAVPMVAVDDSPTRRLVDSRYGTGQSTVDALLRATNLLLAGRTVVVAGYGAAGRGVSERARGLGARVVITEVDAARALDAALQGHAVLPMARAAAVGDVFVTVTGNRDVIRREHLEAMRDGAVLANSGHFDVEIDVRALAELSVEVRRSVRPGADEYVLADGRRLLLLAAGRLANLGAAEGNPPAVMDVAFAGQALAAQWVLSRVRSGAAELGPGVHEVPAEIDAEVAGLVLGALGLSIDVLTEGQRAYLSSWAPRS